MGQPPPARQPGPPPRAQGSARARLAAIARDGALAVPGVIALARRAAGSSAFVTVGVDGEPLHGVLCAAGTGGGYDVSLEIEAALVPLVPLAAAIRASVIELAEADGLADLLDSLSIAFSDVHELAPR
jgi:hypothetical protein